MHFTDYQVDRGRLCDECEESSYQQQHAFALSNSEHSPSLWIHFSDVVDLCIPFFRYSSLRTRFMPAFIAS